MKTKTIMLQIILFVGLYVLPVWGQTVFKIDVVSPPATLPACKTRLKSNVSNGQTTTIFSVYLPRTLELDLGGSTVSYKTENDYYIFSFEADSGTCRVTASGYEVTLSGSSQTSSPTPTPTLVPVPVATPSSPTAEEKKEQDEAKEVDFSIPESPGFTILGLNPQDVTRPTTPRQFATAIINSIDRNGNFQSGIAIDVAPYQLFFGKSVQRDRDYIDFQEFDREGNVKAAKDKKRETAKGYLTRFLWRTQFSLATTKGTTEDDKSARIGAGLNFTLFDFGDPNTDFFLRECNDDVNDKLDLQAFADVGLPGGLGDPNFGAKRAEYYARKIALIKEGFFPKAYRKCVEDSEKRNFGKSSFGVGVAGSWISKDGDSAKFTNNGQGLWASLAYGFEGIPGMRCTEKEIKVTTNRCLTPQLIFHFRRRVKETVPDPLITGMFTTKDSNLFGMRLRVGIPKWSLNFEGVYRGERYAGRTSSSNITASIGADYKLASNLYLNFSVGGETKESSIPGTGKVFIRTSFNWGTSQKPLN